MGSKTYGYVRVSTKDQNEERQVLAMRQFGIPDDQIFVEKQSGKDFNRPVYQNLLQILNPGTSLRQRHGKTSGNTSSLRFH